VDLQHRGLGLHRAGEPCPGRLETKLSGGVAAIGANGAITSTMQAQHPRPGKWARNHTDHVAESRLVGDAIVRFHAEGATPTKSLKILPLFGTTREQSE